MSERFGYILTIVEHYWNRFCRLNKAGKAVHAYVSGAAILKDEVKLIFFYSVRPHKDILGYADFIEREVGDPADLWNRFGQETCFNSFDEYLKVTRGNKSAILIRFKNLHHGSNLVPLDQAFTILGIERMPQTGLYINKMQAEQLTELLT